MVLPGPSARPLLSLWIFSVSLSISTSGQGESPQEKLLANLKAAGVEQRATIETADMRTLPFEPAPSMPSSARMRSITSIVRGLVNRSPKPPASSSLAGIFYLMVVAEEPWAEFTFGPLLKHGGTRGADWWNTRVKEAGFQVLEEGTRPVTLYLLARRSGTEASR